MTPRDFLRWLHGTRRGSTAVYHTGNLQFDRQDKSNPHRAAIDRVGQMAMNAVKDGSVQLTQRRVDASTCAYLARRL